jgi:hypothetical protein
MHIILPSAVLIFFIIGFVSYPRSPWVTLMWTALTLIICAAAIALPIFLVKRPYGDGQVIMVLVMSTPYVVITALLFAFFGRFARSQLGLLRWLAIITVAIPLIFFGWTMSPLYSKIQKSAVENLSEKFGGDDLSAGLKQCKKRFNLDMNYQHLCIESLANRWLDPSSPKCMERITRIRDVMSQNLKDTQYANTQFLHRPNEDRCLQRWLKANSAGARP